MIQTRGRKIIADILAHKGRTAMVSLSIMIGVFGATLLIGAGDILGGQLKADMNPAEVAMLKQYVVLPQGQLSLAENEAFLEQARQLPHVTQVEGQAFYPVSWRLPEATPREDGSYRYTKSNLLAFSPAMETAALEAPTQVIEGRYPVAGQREVAVERRFSEAEGVNLGDVLVFQPQTPEAEATEWTVVGIIYHPFFVIGTTTNGNLSGEDNIYATYADAQEMVGFGGFSAFAVNYDTYDNAQALAHDFAAFVAAETPYVPAFQFVEDPHNTFIMGQVNDVVGVLNMLAIVAIVVSGLLVVNVINTIIVEQKQQIGVLKSLGASSWDIFLVYGGVAFIYGLIGTTLGIALAIPATAYMAQSLAQDALTYIDGFRVSPFALSIGISLGLLVPIVVAIIPVLNGTRISILEALRDFGIASNWGLGWQARIINALPLPMSLRQALSNIAQKQGRLMLTGTVLTMAAAAFMGITAMLTTINNQIDGFFSSIDYEVRINPQDPQDFATMQTLLMNSDLAIDGVYAGYGVNGNLAGYDATTDISAGTNQIFVMGIDTSADIFAFKLVKGEGWKTDPTRDGVLISNPLAEQLNRKVGETITLTLNGETRDLEIIGIIDSASDEIIYHWDKLASWSGYVNAEGQALPNRFYVNMAGSDMTIAEVDDHILDLQKVLASQGIEATYANLPQNAEDNAASLTVFAIIFYIMAGVMAAVGAVGLLAVLSMAVFERQKEIGVMRSIGAGSISILSQFLAEGLLIAFIAWVIALPLSYVFGAELLKTLPFNGVYFSYPPIVVVYGLVGSLAIAAIASLSPAIAASRKTVSEILRYQ